MEAYADTGLVRFEYKNFAFLGPESTAAAEASECAAEQGMFWAYHDTIFLNHEGENVGTYSDPALKNYATALGLDQDQFDDCLDSREYRTNVQVDIAEGRDTGINSTPTIVVNGQIVEGAVSFERLQQIIDSIIGG
jgi:protein-disulfide isomerase